jgi:hypothetical protein
MYQGKVSSENSVNHFAAQDAYNPRLALEIERMEGCQEIDPPQPREWGFDEHMSEHLKDVAILSGESMDTISDFYWANLAYLQRINELVGLLIKARHQEQKNGMVPKERQFP